MAPNVSKDRPRHWNDDVIWLLERVAGVLGSQGHGTGSGSLPRGLPASDVLHYLRATHVALGVAGEVTLQFPTTTRGWTLVAMTYNRTAGAATTMAPRVGQVSGFAADGPDDRVALDSQAVTARINVVFCDPIPFHVDSSFRAYFQPGFVAGADNVGMYQFWFREVYETEEST